MRDSNEKERMMSMKKISMLCFSLTGYETGKRLKSELEAHGYEVLLDGKSKYLENSISEGHVEWTGRQFECADAVIFICACGIAVRSIVPFVKNKKKDPAVLVIDECGKFVISLLSGHLGGANELTQEAAEILGGIPVITTATDIHSKFAVDVFSKKNDCAIFPMNAAKKLSAALLAGEQIGFYSELPLDGKLPEGLVLCDRAGVPCRRADTELSGNACSEAGEKSEKKLRIGAAVSIYRDCSPFDVTVHLVPRIVSLGMGCRKGKDAAGIRQAAAECLSEAGIYRQAVQNIVSIDLKKEEAGLLTLAEEWKLPFITYDAETLLQAPGEYTESTFVQQVTGVSNVCERSAVCASGGGQLIRKKQGRDGVTTALAVNDRRMRFE